MLLGAEDAVAGIAQAGNDVAVLVQVIVHRTHIDVHIGMNLLQVLNAFRGSYQHHELDVVASALLHLGDGGIGGAAGWLRWKNRRWPAWDPR